MFNMYDADGNGQIDKEEFRAVVKKMKSSSRRREFISVAAATFGSLVSHSSSCSFSLRSNTHNDIVRGIWKQHFSIRTEEFEARISRGGCRSCPKGAISNCDAFS